MIENPDFEEDNLDAWSGVSMTAREAERPARQIAKMLNIPEHLIGLSTPWWRRVWQRLMRRS